MVPNKNIYQFPNGSQIFCVGSSNQSYENLRGTRVNLAVIDEAQKIEDLEILVDEVVMPSLFDSNGFLLMFGTIPRQPNHPFMRTYVREAKKDGAYAEFDIYQAGYPQERIDFFRSKVSKEAFEREFECKENSSKKFNVTPNFSFEKHVKAMPKPEYFSMIRGYSAMDIGGSVDQTHVVYAWYDTTIKKLIVRDESVWSAQESRVDRIAESVKSKEQDLPPKVQRVSDTNNFILVKELAEKHKLPFKPVQKGPGSLEAMLEILNIWIENDRIFIDPACKILINELRFGSWNKTRTDLARVAGAHCDGILALAYLLSIVNEKGKIVTKVEDAGVFIPPPKDPLNLKAKRTQTQAVKTADEALAYTSVSETEDIWIKDI